MWGSCSESKDFMALPSRHRAGEFLSGFGRSRCRCAFTGDDDENADDFDGSRRGRVHGGSEAERCVYPGGRYGVGRCAGVEPGVDDRDAPPRRPGEGRDDFYGRAFRVGGVHADTLWGTDGALLLAFAVEAGSADGLQRAPDRPGAGDNDEHNKEN